MSLTYSHSRSNGFSGGNANGYSGGGGYGGGGGGFGGGGGDRMSNLGAGLQKQDWGKFSSPVLTCPTIFLLTNTSCRFLHASQVREVILQGKR